MELPPYSPSTTPLSRYLGWGVLLAMAAVFGALISRFPLFAFALAGCAILLWIAWPTWIHRDIEYFAGAVLVSSTLMGLPRLVQMGPYTLDAALSIVTVIWATLLLAHNSWHIDA